MHFVYLYGPAAFCGLLACVAFTGAIVCWSMYWHEVRRSRIGVSGNLRLIGWAGTPAAGALGLWVPAPVGVHGYIAMMAELLIILVVIMFCPDLWRRYLAHIG